MGYSYGRGPSGRWVLACDECGAADGTARKVRCPFNYCPASALCAACRAIPEKAKTAKKYHVERGCDVSHAEYLASEARRAGIEREGWLLRSALGVHLPDGTHLIQVVFSHIDPAGASSELWALMEKGTYDDDATQCHRGESLADFRALGRVVAGPRGFCMSPGCDIPGGTTLGDVGRAWQEGREPVEPVPLSGVPGFYKSARVETQRVQPVQLTDPTATWGEPSPPSTGAKAPRAPGDESFGYGGVA